MLDKIIVFDQNGQILEEWLNSTDLKGLITAGHVLINMHKGDPYMITLPYHSQYVEHGEVVKYRNYTVVDTPPYVIGEYGAREKHIHVMEDSLIDKMEEDKVKYADPSDNYQWSIKAVTEDNLGQRLFRSYDSYIHEF